MNESYFPIFKNMKFSFISSSSNKKMHQQKNYKSLIMADIHMMMDDRKDRNGEREARF
jgi:hypothetical protein